MGETQTNYDAIVVGAGNGGLTGALTLAKAGKKVLLLEKHNIPGGGGTTFVRGRFEFDVALHTLWGIGDEENPGALRKIFEELEVYDKVEFVEQEEIFGVTVKDHYDIGFPSNKQAYIDKLIEISPDEEKGIRDYMKLVEKMADEFYKLYTFMGKEITQEDFPVLFEMGAQSGRDILYSHIKHPVIRMANHVLDGYTGIPLKQIPFLLLGWLYELCSSHHVKGGAQSISNAIIDEFEKCGGKVIYHAEVKEVLIEDNRTKGVKLKDGRTFYADTMMFNANRMRTYIDYINAKQLPKEIFDDLKVSKPGRSIFGLYIGLNCPPEEVGISHGINYLIDPMHKANRDVGDARGYNLTNTGSAYMSCYNIDDPDYSEPGTSAITLLLGSEIDAWTDLSQEEYHKQKMIFADNTITFLESFYPGIRAHIEELDISTPITHMRYLGSQGGAIYANSAHFKDLICNKLDPRSPIEGLYFSGASVIVGGFNTTYMSGYAVGNLMLKEQF